jgi:ATP-dependent DNA helicase MPH1
MSEGREDANWDKAQRAHREIQEEILHSRNLELFEDVERLLPPGKFPECIEQEMPVDPWNADDQKLKKIPKEKVVKEKGVGKGKGKIGRGHEIPDGAIDGFKSVMDLMKMASSSAIAEEKVPAKAKGKVKAKGKAVGKKRERSPLRSEEEDDEDDDDDPEGQGGLDQLFEEMAKEKATMKKTTKAVALRPPPKKARKVVKKDKPEDTVEIEQERVEQEREQRERVVIKQSALDFFNTECPVRPAESRFHRMTPPTSSPSSSPVIRPNYPQYTPPITDESLNQIENVILDVQPTNDKLTPRTAAIVGFSQIAPTDLSWDENEISSSPCVPTKRVQAPQLRRVRHIGLARPSQGNQNWNMAPPPLPAHVMSSPLAIMTKVATTPGFEPTQFPVRRAGLGRPGPITTEGVLRAEVSSDGSPMVPRNRLRRRRLPSSSPPAGDARLVRRKKVRAAPGEVKKYVRPVTPPLDIPLYTE